MKFQRNDMVEKITYIKRRNCIIKCSQEKLRLISELFVITYSKCKPALIPETAILKFGGKAVVEQAILGERKPPILIRIQRNSRVIFGELQVE
ncbi:hypothetical protein Anas_05709 [Armadillidium nasatum]|uniref:Uncharacterized protein n=1 Tax=Armadillidium nasatum TaxID=96803 RepID=A0A5N5TF91_9CRUS|nr:hypothetical protein Anas_05709 [Armadillidium nasatum]